MHLFRHGGVAQQIIRNMRAVGLDLGKWVDKKLLKFSARRPNLYGLETHLAAMHRELGHSEEARNAAQTAARYDGTLRK